MSANKFGNILSFTSFGESHGTAMGLVIDGFPSGVSIDPEELRQDLARRRPGQNDLVTSRNEEDLPEILSGVFEGKSLGTSICVIVKNKDQRSIDYDKIKNQARIGHADDTWQEKFLHIDHRGGGRSSGRETLSRVIAGYFAKKLLQKLYPKCRVFSYTSEVYDHIANDKNLCLELEKKSQAEGDALIDSHQARFLSDKHEEIRTLLLQAKEEGESYGGKAKTLVFHPPKSLGQPVFHKLKSDLAAALMSIGATQSFHLGEDTDTRTQKGSDFHQSNDSQKYGGIRGGITNGETIIMELGFKPTSSIKDVAKKGRHDPCIIPRACPVIQAMTYWVLADHLLWARSDQA